MPKPTLKPCPICGKQPRFETTVVLTGGHYYWVSCPSKLHTLYVRARTAHGAARRWNTRATPAEAEKGTGR